MCKSGPIQRYASPERDVPSDAALSTKLAGLVGITALGAVIWLAAGGPAEALDLRPGPSGSEFAAPFYSCSRNFYVAATGRDQGAGTANDPWATLQLADEAAGGRRAGDCVNVAPGDYRAGVRISHGGSRAEPGGYVVYRCQQLNACKIDSEGGNAAPVFNIIATGRGPNYVVIDGFDMAARRPVAYGIGVLVSNNMGAPKPVHAAHHIWILNNLIHGFGEAGIATNEADWIFALHNDVFDNAATTCDAQGSGIGLVVAKATPDYSPTPADQDWGPYNQVIAWNVSHDNFTTECGKAGAAYNTDGNGIIVDTFNGSGVDDVLYTKQTLVAGNVVYRNGGKGIQVFRSSFVTVANNTSYDNNLDPWNHGFPRGEISNAGGTSNRYIANIAVARPAAGPADTRCQGATYDIAPAPCPLMANVAFFGGDGPGVRNVSNSWSRNISFGGAPPWGWGPRGNVMLGADVMSCSLNRCNVDPLLTDPQAGDFRLRPGSPAIGYNVTASPLSGGWPDAGALPFEPVP